MKCLLSVLAATTLLVGCAEDKPASTVEGQVIAANDFESLDGWIPATPTLTREVAHSGKYSVTVGGGNEFGLGYSTILGQVASQKPHKLKLEAWAYLTNINSDATLGLQVADPATGQALFNEGIRLRDQVKKEREWTLVSKEITLPDNITYTNQLKVFPWRGPTADAAYLDDVKVSILE